MNKPPRFPWSNQAALNLIFFATLALLVSVNNTLAAETTNAANKVEIVMESGKATYVGSWTIGASGRSGRSGRSKAMYRLKGRGNGSSYVSFRPDLPISGNYEVYEGRFFTVSWIHAPDAPYEIRFKDGSKTIPVNQQINGNRWNLLGVFPFDAGTNGEVRITDTITMGRMVIADRVAFVLSETNAPQAEVEQKTEVLVPCQDAELFGSWTTETNDIGLSDPFPRCFKGKGDGSSYATLRPNLSESGHYEVYERHKSGTNQAADVPLIIIYEGGKKEMKSNQQVNGEQWNLLGTFPFTAGTNGEVRVTDAISTQGQMVLVPMVRFVLVEAKKDQ